MNYSTSTMWTDTWMVFILRLEGAGCKFLSLRGRCGVFVTSEQRWERILESLPARIAKHLNCGSTPPKVVWIDPATASSWGSGSPAAVGLPQPEEVWSF